MKEIKRNKVTVNISLSKEILQRLKEVTEKKGMNRSSYVSMALSNQMTADKAMEDMPRTIQALKELEKQSKERKEMKTIEH